MSDLDLFGNRPVYFDRKGQPLTVLEWGNLFQDQKYKVVKQESVGKYFISTVWIGMDMSYSGNSPIHIFETIIFYNHKDEENEESLIGRYMDRYSTEEEALEGHKKAVKIALDEIE